MSYHIVKSINIDEKHGKVWITGTDNNVFAVNPMTGRERRVFRKQEFPYYSGLLVAQGKDVVEEHIASSMLDGNFKFPGGSDYHNYLLWFQDQHEARQLHDLVWYHYDDSPDKDRHNRAVDKLRREIWREYNAIPKRRYTARVGQFYVSRITPSKLSVDTSGKMTIFYSRKCDLERRLAGFKACFDIEEIRS